MQTAALTDELGFAGLPWYKVGNQNGLWQNRATYLIPRELHMGHGFGNIPVLCDLS